MIEPSVHATVAIVGAGPIGLEVAYELKRAGMDYVQFDRGQVGSTIAWFPRGMSFFSSTDRIAIAGVPIQTVSQTKCTKEEYLAYLRSVAITHDLDVRTYEDVLSIERAGEGFLLRTRTSNGEHLYRADKVVVAKGDMDLPRRLDIPGENLAHVSHYFDDPHPYFRKQVLVVGGRNSAVEAALRCWHVGAKVVMSYRGEAFHEERVKYWLRPELIGRIDRGEITCHYGTEPVRITPTHTTLREKGLGEKGGREFTVPADFVLLLTGYVPDDTLLREAGVDPAGTERRPVYDPETMETNIPGLYVAGTVTGGEQGRYTVFIETCHIHATRIAAALTGATPPEPPAPRVRPES